MKSSRAAALKFLCRYLPEKYLKYGVPFWNPLLQISLKIDLIDIIHQMQERGNENENHKL